MKEAVWLEQNGADAIIAQGAEAGGHRSMFMTDNISSQPGTFALVPQVVDAVRVPVIAAAESPTGAASPPPSRSARPGCRSAPPIGGPPESKVSALGRAALASAGDDFTVITNVMTGRPARGVVNRVMREVGPVSADAPAFPHAATAFAPLRAAAEKHGKVDFSNLWAGRRWRSAERSAPPT